ncbi:MAG: hypothetical protein VX559_11600, partial [Pseudomonadota bacterium]|nr:hypothetical protein [Pseudomonadota bacterium]
MPLSLEHFKLLNAKANSFDRGTGGVPDITFQEVADALATVEYPVSVYARFLYARQRELWPQVIDLMIKEIAKEIDPIEDIHKQIAELAVTALIDPLIHGCLTPAQKAFAVGKPWWTRKNEALYQ